MTLLSLRTLSLTVRNAAEAAVGLMMMTVMTPVIMVMKIITMNKCFDV